MTKHDLLALALVATAACTTPSSGDATPHDATNARAKLAVTSEELKPNNPIPAARACTDYDHLGSSPALAWSGIPDGTQAIAITAVDPDAKGFVHWAVVGIAPSTTSLPAGASPGGPMPAGATEL